MILIVLVVNVLHCSIFKLTCDLPKKDNRRVLSAWLERMHTGRIMGLPIFWQLNELARPKSDNGYMSVPICRRGNVLRNRTEPITAFGGNMESSAVTQNTPSELELADDILEGADAIAEFLFGAKNDRRRNGRRKVYYLAECSRLPIFRLGSVLCARKSVLLNFIAGQESRVLSPHS
jgi:hypothetical protein